MLKNTLSFGLFERCTDRALFQVKKTILFFALISYYSSF